MQVPKARTVLAALFVVAASAPASADGPDPTVVKLTMTARTSDPAVINVAGEAGVNPGARIESIWLAFADIRLRPARSCERPAAVAAAEGRFAVELVSGRLVGLPAELATSAGRYCAMSVGPRRVDESSEHLPAELRGASLVIRGRRSDGLPFTLRLLRTDRLHLPSLDREGFALDGVRTSLILAADAARWFRGINLDLAEPSGDQADHVRIDEHDNPALLEQFKRNLTPGLSLYRDRDANGLLDADELKRPIASGRASRSRPGASSPAAVGSHAPGRSSSPGASTRFVSTSR